MDFPKDLLSGSDQEFVYGYEELKQTFYLLLKTDYGRFLQDVRLGSSIGIHVSDVDLLQVGVTRTLEQVSGVSVTSVQVIGDTVYATVSYRGQVSEFEFSVSSF